MKLDDNAQRLLLEQIRNRRITPEQGVRLLMEPAPTVAEKKPEPDHRSLLEAVKAGQFSPEDAVRRFKAGAGSKPASKTNTSGTADHGPIAVIGMAGVFPGADNPQAFWENLRDGIDSVTEVPADRWVGDDFYDPNPAAPGKSTSKWGGFLERIDAFDPLFFALSPRDAELMDPQQRLFLTTAQQALDDAGYSGRLLAGTACGVFVGCGVGDYSEALAAHGVAPDAQVFLGMSLPILAARLSFLLNLRGPSLAVDTACSSSLTAVRLAIESITTGACDTALAGGVSIFSTPRTHVLSGKAGMLSPTGRCHTFGARADGFVPAESVAVVLLKPLEAAMRDGDQIYGQIIASGLNQDGKSNGITAPSATSQTQLEAGIYARFGIDPETISLVEAHGTGTRLGDPIEVSALTDAFAQFTAAKNFCVIGSAKANIGHASSAAGVVGLIKVLLCMKHRTLPPHPNLGEINPHIQLEDSPFKILKTAQPWHADGTARTAALSSFGFSGTNVHMVVREPAQPQRQQVNELQLLVFSDRDEAALQRRLKATQAFLAAEQPPCLADAAYTLMCGRSHEAVRVAVLADSIEELVELLQTVDVSQGWYSSQHAVGQVSAWRARALDCLARLRESSAMGTRRETLSTLADCYVNGADVDWSQLFTGDVRRTSLPGYVFDLQRYWIPAATERELELKPGHPLLDRVVLAESLTQGLVFEADLKPSDVMVRDHRVWGRPVLPGTALLEMVNAAARLVFPGKIPRLTKVTWRQPVFVDQAQTLRLELGPWEQGYPFKFRTAADIHCAGQVQLTDGLAPEIHDVQGLIAQADRVEDGDALRSFFASRRIEYGPAFSGLQRLHSSADWVIGRIELPRAARPTVGFYHFQPALADAALQAAACLFRDFSGLVLPYALEEMTVFAALPESGYACARRCGELALELLILDDEGCCHAHLQNLRLRSAPATNDTQPNSGRDSAGMDLFLDAFTGLERVASQYLWRGLDLPQSFTSASVIQHLGVIPKYHRLLHELLDLLVRDGYLMQSQGRYQAAPNTAERDETEIDGAVSQLEGRCPQIKPFVRLVQRCTRALGHVLSGREEATGVLFPTGSPEDVAGIYSGNVLADWFNQLVATEAADFANRLGRPIRILEVGAGTGSTTRFVLEALRERGLSFSYVFTDISPAFARSGAAQFANFQELSSQTLDLEQDPAVQGYGRMSFDLVLASNVVHATKDIKVSLKRLKWLLDAGGMLLLNEITRVTRFGTLTFGMTSGWWAFEDESLRLPGSPLLNPASWRAAFDGLGFESSRALGTTLFAGRDIEHAVLTAISDGEVRGTELQQAPIVPKAVQALPAFGQADAETEYVRGILAGVLKVSPQTLAVARSLEEYGIDSLVTQQVVEAFKPDFGELPATLVFEYPTVAELTAYLRKSHGSALAAAAATGQAKTAKPLFAATAKAQAQPAPLREAAVSTDVAVIGIAGRYPMAGDVNAFWENLRSGRDCIAEVPVSRWDWRQYYDPNPDTAGKSYTGRGGFISDVDCFDARFFKISPREAEGMDPQERLFLETAWHAVEDAGYNPLDLGLTQRVGVFVGVMNGTYSQLGAASWREGQRAQGQTAYWSIANRVSFCLDYRGPSMAVDTACSSSLTAIHLACNSINGGDCEAAIAGGVNLILHPSHLVCLSDMRMLSPSGHCHSFGAGADGFVDGEGVGAVLLKSMSAALADCDPILGVVKGGAVNSGGRTTGYTVPSPQAQARVIAQAVERSGIEPQTLTYLEAHGTGTSLGDPIEIAGLRRGLAEAGDQLACALGSVKSNIGHLESAAGIAGLTKVLLQMRHGELAASLHLESLNPKLNLADSGLHLQTAHGSWPQIEIEEDGQRQRLPRRAGISSFGAGGSNAHLIIEAGPQRQGVLLTDGPRMVVLSSNNEAGLKRQAQSLLRYLQTHETATADMAYTLQVGRAGLDHRLAFVASDQAEVIAGLGDFLEDGPGAFHVGCVGKSQPMVLSGKAGEAFLNAALQEREWDTLAGLWVTGVDFDWKLFWPAGIPNRISLPGYVFAPTRHWLKTDSGVSAAKSQLLGEMDPVASLGEGAAFIIELDPSQPLIANHRVSGQGVLPGVAFLEAAREAWHRLYDGDCQINDVVWIKPLVVTGAIRVHLRLTAAGNFLFEDDSGVYARGSFGKPSHEGAERFDKKLREDLSVVDPATVYTRLCDLGIEHGGDFKVLEALYSGQSQAVAQLKPAPASEGWRPEWLDGALQAICGILGLEDRAVLPFAMDGVRFFTPPVGPLWVHAVRTDNETFRVGLYLSDGRPAMLMDRVQARPMAQTDMFFRPAWLRVRSRRKKSAGPLVICHFGNNPQAALEFAGENAGVLDLSEPKAVWDAVLADASHLCVLGFRSHDADLPVDHEVMGLFGLIKRLQALGYGQRALQLTILTAAACDVCGDTRIVPQPAGLHGMALSAAREQLAWQITCVDLDSHEPVDGLLELDESVIDGLLAVRHGHWLRQRLEPVVLPKVDCPYRRGGHYLIAGGAGGIGLALAAELANQYDAKISLLGRSDHNDSIRRLMRDLPEDGVKYYSADLTDKAALGVAITRAEADLGPIHGVFHAALVLADATIGNMDEAGFHRALDPKMIGSVNLDACLGDRPLDFCVFFSSAQSFMGNAGQANYAAGCTFMDAWAAFLSRKRPYSVKTLNWGYWGETGSVASPAYRERLTAMGIIPISTRLGMTATEQALSSPLNQLVPFRAKAALLKKLGIDTASRRMVQRPIHPSHFDGITKAVPMPDISSEMIELVKGFTALDQAAGAMFLTALDAINTEGIDPRFNRLVQAAKDQVDPAVKPLSLDQVETNFPQLRAYVRLLSACASAYTDVLRGVRTAAEVMFPEGSSDLVSGIYRGNALADGLNHLVAQLAATLAQQHAQPLRILEIGAGTGGTSDGVLAAFSEFQPQTYVYTDLSPAFLKAARERYADRYDFVSYEVLDISKPPSIPGDFDLIIAANVLHATPNMDHTLRHVRELLKPGGMLVLNELTAISPFTTLTFGLLDGWWAYEDDRRLPGGPLLSLEGWRVLLSEVGFDSVTARGFNQGQQVVIAENGCWAGSSPPPPKPKPKLKSRRAPRAAQPQTVDKRHLIEARICEAMSTTLGVGLEELDLDTPHSEFGLDSILGAEVIGVLNEKWNWDLSATDVFNYATISELAGYVLETKGDGIGETDTSVDEDGVGEDPLLLVLEDLQAGRLSLEEVDQLLDEDCGLLD